MIGASGLAYLSLWYEIYIHLTSIGEAVEIIDWKSRLNCCKYDANVGIRIARLAGDGGFATYLTVIDPGQSVTPHYHASGDEHYHILSGAGEVSLYDRVANTAQTAPVSEQQSFVVNANTVHCLKNTGAEPLVLMFSCPESHLQQDRHFPQA
jgi:mannose-6-phosphate isomerase-like protein (cupin superfamily)